MKLLEYIASIYIYPWPDENCYPADEFHTKPIPIPRYMQSCMQTRKLSRMHSSELDRYSYDGLVLVDLSYMRKAELDFLLN
jgi:hypothetical protein